MPGSTWKASGRPRSTTVKVARPAGSWGAALGRAEEAYGQLGGSARCLGCGAVGRVVAGQVAAIHTGDMPHDDAPLYSDIAAAAILATALGLWADTAASMGEPDEVVG